MRWLFPLLLLLPCAPSAGAATYADPARYCAAVDTVDTPDARYDGPRVPDWIARALMQATGAPPDAPLDVFRRAAWRCYRGQVLACSYGANIPCDVKADTSRLPPAGAQAFCAERPDAEVVPAYATGRATIFEWRCQGKSPVIVRQVQQVDARGFPAGFWHRVAPAR